MNKKKTILAAGLVLGENTLRAVLNVDELPSASTEVDLAAAIRNRIFNPANPNSLVARLCFEITFAEAVTRRLVAPPWVRNVGIASATSELEEPTRTIFLNRVDSLERRLERRRR